jgi:hypothetical protein
VGLAEKRAIRTPSDKMAKWGPPKIWRRQSIVGPVLSPAEHSACRDAARNALKQAGSRPLNPARPPQALRAKTDAPSSACELRSQRGRAFRKTRYCPMMMRTIAENTREMSGDPESDAPASCKNRRAAKKRPPEAGSTPRDAEGGKDGGVVTPPIPQRSQCRAPGAPKGSSRESFAGTRGGPLFCAICRSPCRLHPATVHRLSQAH